MLTSPALPTELDTDLAGLSAVAAQWIARLPVSDQRVQSVPDGRTLRFYQSTGLLDRPTRYDGRIARYGRRHLLQLLAIRALQVRGLSLAQVQTALAGASDAELTQSLDAAFGMQTCEELGAGAPAAVSAAFVSAVPATPGRAAPAPATPVSAAPAAVAAPPTAFMAAELAPGVVITIDSRVYTDPARLIAVLRRAIQGEEQ